eukprot:m.372371 g.372371  ORF g.372371 m.372371 type:complete len:312 (-) comp20872_c0_seq2:1391-2326(-)
MLLHNRSSDYKQGTILAVALLYLLHVQLYPDDGVKETDIPCTRASLREAIKKGNTLSKTSMSHHTVAIITYFSEDSSDLGTATAGVNANYARQHGYTFIRYTTAPIMYQERRPAWYKMYFVQKTLESGNFTFVMWIDSDAMFCNPLVDLSRYIDMMESRDWLLAQDPGYSFREIMAADVRALNSGAFIVRNSEWVLETLTFILTDSIFKDNHNYDPAWSDERKAMIASGITGWDQAAVRYVYHLNRNSARWKMFVVKSKFFNNNAHNMCGYIAQGGFILHGTNFNGQFENAKKKMYENCQLMQWVLEDLDR